MAVQRQDEHWRGGRGGGLLAERRLDRLDGVLERGVVELDHVLVPGRSTAGEPSSQVDVHDVEPAGAQPEVEGLGVDDHLVAFAHLPDQRAVRPRGALLALHVDRQRVGRDHHPPAKLQHRAAAS